MILRARLLSSRVLNSSAVRQFDSAVAGFAERESGSSLANRSMYLLSQAANHSLLWHAINTVDATFGDHDRRTRALRRSVILACEQAIINGPVKLVASRERPSVAKERPHTLRTPRTSSFPSGHASAAACAATLLTEDLGHAPLWWSLAGAVSWSRVHVGVHYGSDVVAGLVAGGSMALVAGRLWPGMTATGHL